VRFIEEHAPRGKVFVHCKAGHGRSASVAYAWLLKRNRGRRAPYELYESLARTRRIRPLLWRQPEVLKYYEGL